jgi:hypothetical protein
MLELVKQRRPSLTKRFLVYRDQFGTRNLQAVLSRKLAGLSLEALPSS